MLDQNTDRMWFVIGAVIVGAAIIFIANGTLPTLFASVSDTFKDASVDATDVVSEMEPNVSGQSDKLSAEELSFRDAVLAQHEAAVNLARPADFIGQFGTTYTYNASTGISDVVYPAGSENRNKGVYPNSGIRVRPDERLTISFDVYSDKSERLYLDFNNVNTSYISGNDPREYPSYNMFGSFAGMSITIPAGEWITVVASYVPNDSAPIYTDSAALVFHGVPDEDIVLNVKNMKWTVRPNTVE